MSYGFKYGKAGVYYAPGNRTHYGSVGVNYGPFSAYGGGFRKSPRKPAFLRRSGVRSKNPVKSVGPVKFVQIAGAPKRPYSSRGTLRKFKKPRRKVHVPKAAYKGMTITQETGGIVTDPNCLYVGHSTGTPEQIYRAYMGAVVKELFRQNGTQFGMWEELATISGEINCIYYSTPSSTAEGIVTIAYLSTDSYYQIVDAVVAALQAAFGTAQPHEFVRFRISNSSGVSIILANKMKVMIDVSSTLVVQNETKSGTVSVPSTDIENITNNPIQGYSYEGSGNYFIPSARTNGDASYLPFRADQTSGVLTNTAAASLPEVGKEPPKPWFFLGTKRSGKVIIDPGNIKKSYLSTKRTMSIKMFQKIFQDTITDTSQPVVRFGKVRMFSLEKVLNNRTGENDIQIGYEVQQRVSVSISYTNRAATADFVVQ